MASRDEHLRDRVAEQLQWDARVDASDVHVEVDNGKVTLSGTVPSYTARGAAMEGARVIPGVVDVDNRLAIEPSGPAATMDDDDLRQYAQSILEWNAYLDPANLRVNVDSGVVKLNGMVDRFWKKRYAGELVAGLMGVLAVENELSVVPEGNILDAQIAGDVRSALERNAAVEADAITVEVSEGEVTLSGTVGTWHERRLALDVAAHTLGVVEVEDKLTVQHAPAV